MTPIPADDPLREAAQAYIDAREAWLAGTEDDNGFLVDEAHDRLRAALHQPAHPEPVEHEHHLSVETAHVHCVDCEMAFSATLPFAALRADSHDGEGLDVADLEWLVWFGRKSKGKVAEVVERAVEQYPPLRAARSKEPEPQKGDDEPMEDAATLAEYLDD